MIKWLLRLSENIKIITDRYAEKIEEKSIEYSEKIKRNTARNAVRIHHQWDR